MSLELEICIEMKSFEILGVILLLIWQSGALVAEESTTSDNLESSNADLKFSARLIATNVAPIGNPVDAARRLIRELGKFNLMGEVVQAKFIEYKEFNRLIFEMSNALQAKSVFQAYTDAEDKPKSQISRTNDYIL